MSNRPTVATSSKSFNAWTGPAVTATAVAALGTATAVVELELLVFPVLPLQTMMRPIYQNANPRPYM